MESPASSLLYAGFWRRLGAMLIDYVVWIPYVFIVKWGNNHFGHYRLLEVYILLPNIVISLLYSVVLVARFGGTPGKLILGMQIVRLDGAPIGLSRAFVRNFPELLLTVATVAALCIPLLNMSDETYVQIAPNLVERRRLLEALAPPWYQPMQIVGAIWVYGELLVILTNKKRRALHDFLAGTVVVYMARPLSLPRRWSGRPRQ